MRTLYLSNCTYQPDKGGYELFGGGYNLVRCHLTPRYETIRKN